MQRKVYKNYYQHKGRSCNTVRYEQVTCDGLSSNSTRAQKEILRDSQKFKQMTDLTERLKNEV